MKGDYYCFLKEMFTETVSCSRNPASFDDDENGGVKMGIRDSLEKKIEGQLEKWENEIEEMKARSKKKEAEAKAEKADADIQQEYYDRIETLQKASKQARQKLEELRQAGEDSLEGLRSEIEKLLNK